MNSFNYTNHGPRNLNEDSFSILNHNGKLYACVADGVGGLKHGDFASKYAVDEFNKYCTLNIELDFPSFLKKLNLELIEIAKEKFGVDVIGTTFTGCVISQKKLSGVHVGDSRAYILRGNGLKQLTSDQNELERLIKEGKLNESDRRFYPRKNIIESILGGDTLFKIQEFEFELLPNDRIILSTDGFYDAISKIDIRDISIRVKSFHEFCRLLQIEVENRILHDNATFVCIEI